MPLTTIKLWWQGWTVVTTQITVPDAIRIQFLTSALQVVENLWDVFRCRSQKGAVRSRAIYNSFKIPAERSTKEFSTSQTWLSENESLLIWHDIVCYVWDWGGTRVLLTSHKLLERHSHLVRTKGHSCRLLVMQSPCRVFDCLIPYYRPEFLVQKCLCPHDLTVQSSHLQRVQLSLWVHFVCFHKTTVSSCVSYKGS